MNKTRDVSREHVCGFTLIELLVVISIIGVLAGLTLAVLPGVMKNRNVKRLHADHAALVTAIDSYKSGQGFFPAGNSANSAQAPLVYELRGVTVDSSGTSFSYEGTTLTSAQLTQYLGVSGIANASGPGEPPAKDYFPTMPPKMVANIPGTAVKRFVSGVRGRDGEQLVFHYDVTSQNRNNPDTYDLWINYVFKGKTNRVANW